MLTTNVLKQKLRQGERVFGLFISIPSSIVIEMVAHAGFDFVIIDTEHVLVNPQTIEDMIRAAELRKITPLVRVADVNPKEIVRLLDSGAQGIVVANMENSKEVERLVRAAKYFPQGERSMNSGRPGVFGANDLVDYMRAANEETLLVAMIESRLGVQHVSEMLSVPGIDMVLEGAADLSQSFGVPWQTDAEIVKQAIQQVFENAQHHSVAFCAIPRHERDYEHWSNYGVSAFVLGDERGTAFRALQMKLKTAKENLGDEQRDITTKK